MNMMTREAEVRLRQRELMKQAENQRLASMARERSGHPLLARLGRQMVVLGNRLQNQAQPHPVEAGRRLRTQW